MDTTTDATGTAMTGAAAPSAADVVFAGPGEMRALCRALDWAATPLGPVERWPASLRTAAGLVLAAPTAMIVLWGPAFVQVYNDAYRAVMGAKHPAGLGQPNRACWPEVWAFNAPLYAGVVERRETFTFTDQRLVVGRHGHPEEAFFTLAYSPVPDDRGSVGGVLVTVFETTAQLTRREVERLLAESERACAALEMANAQLEDQQVELELANQQLQDQTAELEMQAEELQATAVELEGQVEAAERARAALAESERQFHTLADAIPTLAWTAGPDGAIDWYNAQWYAYTGTTPEDMAGWGWQSVHDAAVLPDVLARWQASIATGVPFEMTFPLRGADGVFRPFLTRVAPVRDAGGAITRWFGTNTDVTVERAAAAERERLLAAERVAAGRARLLQALTAAFSAALTPEAVVRVLLEHGVPALGATTGILMLRDATGTTLVSAGAHGYPADVLDGIARLPLDADLPIAAAVREHRSVWVEDPEDGARTYPSLGPVYAATGNCATAALPLTDAAGRVIGALAFNYAAPRTFDPEARAFKEAVARQCAQALEHARLFAAERAARAEAEEARSAAEAANQAKSGFLANMSHELRTPLNAIGGYAQLLELGLHGPVTDDQRAALGRVQGAQRRLLALINDVLNYAKLEGGRVEYDVRPIDVRDVIAEVVPLVEPQMAAKGLAFDVRLPDGPCVAWADRDKLGQVLLNLLSNAAKFTDAGTAGGAPGRVTIDVARRATEPGPRGPAAGLPDLLFLRVADTGRGIPRDRQDAIFEPFVQVRTGYAQATEGTGLGLAISRDLARGMGGDLRVRSAPGEGATFTVALRRGAPA